MTFNEIYERIGSLESGGYLTSDSRYDKGFIFSLVNSARAVIVNERWKADMAIPPIYYMRYETVYDAQSQSADSCSTIFYNTPEIIALDNRASGVSYVGTVDGTPMTFREVTNRAEFAAQQNDRIMRSTNNARILFGYNTIEAFYKNRIKHIALEMIPRDPRQIPTYDIELSQYPLDEGDLARVDTYLMQGSMNATVKTIADRIANSKDNTQP